MIGSLRPFTWTLKSNDFEEEPVKRLLGRVRVKSWNIFISVFFSRAAVLS